MSNDNLKTWDAVAKPPKEALKQIGGGRLKGMTDIKPQWRYKVMTEQFGPCGVGWKYTITKEWTEPGSHDQLLCFVNVDLFFKHGEGSESGGGVWSDAVPGSGGSMLVTKESAGLHTSDEGFKMALTDALSVAMSRIGVAAEIYMGNWTGSKYKDEPQVKQEPLSDDKLDAFLAKIKKGIDSIGEANYKKALDEYNVDSADKINPKQRQNFITFMRTFKESE